MKLSVRHMSAPKRGEKPEDCDDRFGWAMHDAGRMACAVADGATEATFAGLWAETLVQTFTGRPRELGSTWNETMELWLAEAQTRWQAQIPWHRLPWHGKEKTKRGSLATVLGVILEREPCGASFAWRAVSIGDCCAFITGQEDTLLTALPIADAWAFGNHPDLVSSNAERNDGIAARATLHSGSLHPGQRMILTTDAAAQWLLLKELQDDSRWEEVRTLDSNSFPEWVCRARDLEGMKNDDVTIAVIESR